MTEIMKRLQIVGWKWSSFSLLTKTSKSETFQRKTVPFLQAYLWLKFFKLFHGHFLQHTIVSVFDISKKWKLHSKKKQSLCFASADEQITILTLCALNSFPYVIDVTVLKTYWARCEDLCVYVLAKLAEPHHLETNILGFSCLMPVVTWCSVQVLPNALQEVFSKGIPWEKRAMIELSNTS